MFKSLRKVIGYALLGAMLATAVPTFAAPQGKKTGKKGGRGSSGKAGKKGGGRGSSK